MTNNDQQKHPHFWHPPLWKWSILLTLLACSAVLLIWMPSPRKVKVQLLPFTDSPPAWNGSYPYLTISPVDTRSTSLQFKSSILLIPPTVRHDSPIDEFQVDLHSGMFILRQTDLFVSDAVPLALVRTYRPWDSQDRAFGPGTNHPYDICPTGTQFPYTYMDLNLEDGRQIHLPRISKGTGYADAVFRHSQTSSEFYGAQIAWNGDGWTLNFNDGRRFLFPDAYHGKTFAQGAPYDMREADGRRIQLKRDMKRNLHQLISPSGHTITFTYDDSNRIVEAKDDAGNVRKYSYDAAGYLTTVADASHPLYGFQYQLFHYATYSWYLMTAVLDGGGRVLLRNIYKNSDGGMVSKQRLANGDVYRYEYIRVKHNIVETIVDDPTGRKKFFFQHGIFMKEE